MPFVGQPGLGGYGAMWDRRMLDSQMANEQLNRRATLENMAASAQNREFAAAKQPHALEQMALANQTTKAQLPGIQADASIKSLEAATQEKLGVDHKVEDAKISQREKNQKLIKEQAETIGQIAAQASGMPPMVQMSYIGDAFNKIGMPQEYTAHLSKLDPIRRVAILNKLAEEGMKSRSEVVTQLEVNRDAADKRYDVNSRLQREAHENALELQRLGLSEKNTQALAMLEREYALKGGLEKLKATLEKQGGEKAAKSLGEYQAKILQRILERKLPPEQLAAEIDKFNKISAQIDYDNVIKAGIVSGENTGIVPVTAGGGVREAFGATGEQAAGVAPKEKSVVINGTSYTEKEVEAAVRQANPNATEELIKAKTQKLLGQ